MNNKRQFFICEICGNLVEKIEDSGVPMICCGQEMTLLKENTIDASKEKHVPVITIENDVIKVNVGSVPHPMEKEHYIGWIVFSNNNITIRKNLSPGDNPEMIIPKFTDGKIKAYAWCNIHGLWSSEK